MREHPARTAPHRLLPGLAAALLLPCAAAAAGLDLPSDTSVALGVASDKVVRGLSHTAGQTSYLLDAGWRSAGGWLLSLSSASLHDGGATEAIVGLGWQRQIDARWQFQAGMARYLYRSAPDGVYPYTEAYLAADWDGRLGLLVASSPDTRFTRRDGSAPDSRSMHGEITWHQRLYRALALDLGIGHIDFDNLPGYRYGSASLSWSEGPVQIFLTRVDSNAAERGIVPERLAGGRWILSLTRRF